MRVRADAVDVVLDDAPILCDVSVEVAPGEVVGVVGPNGQRQVHLSAHGVPHRAARWRRGISRRRPGVEAVRPAVRAAGRGGGAGGLGRFDFTVHEVVTMSRTPHKHLLERDSTDDATIVAGALARVGLAGRLYATLSGGEKQLTLLAWALAQQGQLLVLDEPTNHLDVHAQLELLEMVRELGVTTLLAVHDLNLAASYCDRLSVMSGGRVVASGQVADVLTPALIERGFGVSVFCEIHPRTGRWHLVLTLRRDAPPS